MSSPKVEFSFIFHEFVQTAHIMTEYYRKEITYINNFVCYSIVFFQTIPTKLIIESPGNTQ